MRIKRILLDSVRIDDFSEYIEISKKRITKPYIKNKCRLPKKYLNSDIFIFDKKNRLINKETGEIIVKNKRTAGKPRYKKVNGQEIYNGNISRQARASLVKKIHGFLAPYLQNIKIPDNIDIYPLSIELLFYVNDLGKGTIDNDNRWIWIKCVRDTLTEIGKWVDDNNNIVSRDEFETILIPKEEPQSLIINIYGRTT